MKKYPLVLVEWLDARSHIDWQDVAKATSRVPSFCETVGFLLHSDDLRVVLAASTGTDPGERGLQVTDVSVIPRGMVQGIYRLRRRGNYESPA